MLSFQKYFNKYIIIKCQEHYDFILNLKIILNHNIFNDLIIFKVHQILINKVVATQNSVLIVNAQTTYYNIKLMFLIT